ncbi:hypothetical protein, partial [Falsiroseomonas oryzae]|uniref:hypothetical protein n=1 Tax=Falsiroseomonas oryzae TaxID=2766473 RepID=UPI0022EB2C5C
MKDLFHGKTVPRRLIRRKNKTSMNESIVSAFLHRSSLAMGMLAQVEPTRALGSVRSAQALALDVVGLRPVPVLGERLAIGDGPEPVRAEVVATGPDAARALAFGRDPRIGAGAPVRRLGLA